MTNMTDTPLPLVSVVMASYNHEEYVAEAIESVLNQSLSDIELIVVDDGSSDSTADIAASFADPRLKLIRLEQNRAYHPRNIGIDQAKGTYIAFQNSDDAWLPEKLETQLQIMEKQQDCIACFTATEIIDADGKPDHTTWAEDSFTTTNRSSAEWLRYFFFRGNCLAMPSAMTRKAALLQAGCFRPSLVQLGDMDLWIRLATTGELHIIDKPLTRVRIIKGRNLSRPAKETKRRGQIERASVLERYTEPATLQRFKEVFPEWKEYDEPGAQKIAFALYCLDKKGGRSLFADRTIASVLDNPEEREQAVTAHGNAFIHSFLEKRGEMKFAPINRWRRLAGKVRKKLNHG